MIWYDHNGMVDSFGFGNSGVEPYIYICTHTIKIAFSGYGGYFFTAFFFIGFLYDFVAIIL